MPTQIPTPKGEITIRLASPADAAMVRNLRLEALSMHPDAFAADFDLTAAEAVTVWQERIAEYARTHSSAISIACNGVTVVGMAGIGRGHWPKTQHAGTLWGVFVLPDWRAMHLGEALVNGCLAWAAENSLKVVNLGVNVSNPAAIGCYYRCGFVPYGIEPRVIYNNGIYHDELLMAKLL